MMKDILERNKENLKNQLRYGMLRVEGLENPGLYDGKLGMAIIFYEYSRYSGDSLYEALADEIMDSILELSNALSGDFSNGLTGIGWGFVYLCKEHFIDGDNDDILSDVNNRLKQFLVEKRICESDYTKYVIIRNSYVNQEQLFSSSYDESQILEEIWQSCLY